MRELAWSLAIARARGLARAMQRPRTMSYDRDSKDPPRADGDDAAPDDDARAPPDDEVQRRGRERMLEIWRAAVRGVTEAAERARALPAKAAAPTSAEPPAAEDEAPASTWVFPAKSAARGSGN